MSDRPIIEVENLGKRYRLGAGGGQRKERYTALRDVIAEKARRLLPGRRKRNGAEDVVSADPQEFWALKDVSFTVRPGEVVGIIGRNGAGKSTLLKILSRITEPTEGRVTLRGRVASLLEVGTGFHPELTGRENIFLNGAVLGMQRAEIKAKFDEIVAFAEVERFLDTPVKRYSSGMYVRLAFAVAAHLEPEILIVDEVLAVGDAEFQKKCLGKMESVAKGEGRTVLFVSHNMGAIAKLCSCGLMLEDGRLIFEGVTGEAIRSYLKAGEVQSSVIDLRRSVSNTTELKLHGGRLLRAGIEVHEFVFGDELTISLDIEVVKSCRFGVELLLRDGSGAPIAFLPAGFVGGQSTSEPGGVEAICSVRKLFLAQGLYSFDVILAEAGRHIYQSVESAFCFQVISAQVFDNGWEFRQSGGQSAILWPPETILRQGHHKMLPMN